MESYTLKDIKENTSQFESYDLAPAPKPPRELPSWLNFYDIPKYDSLPQSMLDQTVGAAEGIGHLAAAPALWLFSNLSGLAYTGKKKVDNLLLKDAISNTYKTDIEYSKFLSDKITSPTEIKKGAEDVKTAINMILPEPQTKSAKAILTTVGKGFDKLLGWTDEIDKFFQRHDLPNVGTAAKFLAELGTFKAIHATGKKAYKELSKIRQKVEAGKATQADVEAALNKLGLNSEDLSTPEARQAYIDSLKDFDNVENLTGKKLAEAQQQDWVRKVKARQKVVADRSAEYERRRQNELDFVKQALKRTAPNRTTAYTDAELEQFRQDLFGPAPETAPPVVSGAKTTVETNTESQLRQQIVDELHREIAAPLAEARPDLPEAAKRIFEAARKANEAREAKKATEQTKIDAIDQAIARVAKRSQLDPELLKSIAEKFGLRKPAEIPVIPEESTPPSVQNLKEAIPEVVPETPVSEIIDRRQTPIDPGGADNLIQAPKVVNGKAQPERRTVLPKAETSKPTPIDLDRLPNWVENELEYLYKEKGTTRMHEVAKQLLDGGELATPGLVKTFKKWYNENAKELEAAKVEEDTALSKLQKVDPETGRPSGVEAPPPRPSTPSDIEQEIMFENTPLKSSSGKIVTNRVMAQALADAQGRVGQLIKDPKSDGWLVKMTKEQRAERAANEQKYWDQILKDEGVDAEPINGGAIKDIFDILGDESGEVKIDFNKKKKESFPISPFETPKRIEKFVKDNYSDLFPDDVKVKWLNNMSIPEDWPKNANASYDWLDNTVYIAANTKARIAKGLPNLSEVEAAVALVHELKHLKEANSIKTWEDFNKRKVEALKEGFSEDDWAAHPQEQGPIKSGESIREKYSDFLRNVFGESGQITIDPAQIKKIKELISSGKYNEKDILRGLRSRGVTETQINSIVEKSYVQNLKEGKSKFLESGQDPNELLPARTKAGGRKAPPPTRGEAHAVATMKDFPGTFGGKLGEKTGTATKVGRYVNEEFSWRNPIRSFERLGDDIKEIFYRPVSEAEAQAVRDNRKAFKELKKIRKTVSPSSAKRIGTYAIAKQEGGVEALAKMGITKIPELTETELKAYNAMREKLKSFYDQVNAAREAAGDTKFPAVDNYFPWIGKQTFKGRAFDDVRTIESKVHDIRVTPSFRHAKHRGGEDVIRDLELDAFRIADVYTRAANEYINKGPTLAKLRELTLKQFGMAQNAPNAYNFIRQWLDYQAGAAPSWEISNPTTRAAIQKLTSNVATSILTFGVRTALIQPAAIANTFAMVDSMSMAKGVLDSLSPTKVQAALAKSNKLGTRSPEALIYDAFEWSPKGIGKPMRVINKIGMSVLDVPDKITALVSWLAAYNNGLKKFKGNDKMAVNFADDVVTKTQASATRSDRAPIQRTVIGKALTGLQTFTINNWGFLTRDVLGMNNAKISNPTAVKRVIKYILATSLINSFYEDVLNLQSPNPTPIRAAQESYEKTENSVKAFAAGAKELLEYVPIYSSVRYDQQLGGPLISTLADLYKKADKVSSTEEFALQDLDPLFKLLGVPGTNQFFKMVRAYERDGTKIDVVLGRKLEKEKTSKQSGLGGLGGGGL